MHLKTIEMFVKNQNVLLKILVKSRLIFEAGKHQRYFYFIHGKIENYIFHLNQ